ncbi:aldo/keto reductase, partial [Staphylococcus epidermidis]|uniref:aldo/keto reductase n=1 Tax=Staphylococcus epidermidis TaxID=1282 RepID=UPI0021B321B2
MTSKLCNDYQAYHQTIHYFNKSLHNLRLHYLHLFLIHSPSQNHQFYIQSYKPLQHLYQQPKIKPIPLSNFNIHHLQNLIKQTKITPHLNQIHLHPYFNQQHLQHFSDQHHIKLTPSIPLIPNKPFLHHPLITHIPHPYHKTPPQILLPSHLPHNPIIIPKSQTPKPIKQNFHIFHFNLELTDVAEI